MPELEPQGLPSIVCAQLYCGISNGDGTVVFGPSPPEAAGIAPWAKASAARPTTPAKIIVATLFLKKRSQGPQVQLKPDTYCYAP